MNRPRKKNILCLVKTTYSQTEYCYYFIISWGAEKAIIPLTVVTVRLAGFDPRTNDCFHHASLFGRRLPYSNPVVAELADYRGDEAGQQATQQHLLPAQAHQPVNHTAFHGRKKTIMTLGKVFSIQAHMFLRWMLYNVQYNSFIKVDINIPKAIFLVTCLQFRI